jgi:RNA-binding protein YlmH
LLRTAVFRQAHGNILFQERKVRAAATSGFLSVLARELANELMERDAGFYRNKFERFFDSWLKVKELDNEAKKARLDKICEEYDDLSKFDEV